VATFVCPDSKPDAQTVPKLSGKDSPANIPHANQKVEYEDLEFDSGTQLTSNDVNCVIAEVIIFCFCKQDIVCKTVPAGDSSGHSWSQARASGRKDDK
jgi:hypothetical protein